jgi:hypothetical protein
VPEQNIPHLFAFIAISKNNKIMLSKKIIASGKEPAEVQLYFTHQAINLLTSVLKKK